MSRSPDSEMVTPGRIALLLSVTAPVMDPVCTCAYVGAAAHTQSAISTKALKLLIPSLALSLGQGHASRRVPVRSSSGHAQHRRLRLLHARLAMAADSDLRGVWRQYVATGHPSRLYRWRLIRNCHRVSHSSAFWSYAPRKFYVHETVESVTVEASRLQPRIAQRYRPQWHSAGPRNRR